MGRFGSGFGFLHIFQLAWGQLIVSGEPTIHKVRFESSPGNSFTRMPAHVISFASCLTSGRRRLKPSRTSGMSSLVTRRSGVRNEVFGPDRAFRKGRVSRGCPIALRCVGVYTTGSGTGVARSVGESDLASRQPSRQPSSQKSRHTAGVKRLELMACQPARPICCDSVRS
jgi:hypothetical protein